MGAGTVVAGLQPAGLDTPQANAQGVVRTTPEALRYDAASRDFLLDADQGLPYQYASIHPIDQMVALRLQIKLGSIKSVPLLGTKFHLIPLDTKAAASAQNEVSRVLKDLIDDGSITIRRVVVVVRLMTTGSLVVVVEYVNNRISGAGLASASNAPQLISETDT